MSNPVSETAYYCLGARLVDAQSKRPLCNDIYAHLFMDEHGARVFDDFRSLKFANRCSAVRSRIVEDALRERLAKNADLQVIVIGAGFDTKAFRLQGGSWIEIDEAALIERKNKYLPVSDCPNPLKRFAVDFAKDELKNVLARFDNQRETVFVIEGVLMYLSVEDINALLQTLRAHFPQHVLICDLMSNAFISRYMGTFLRRIKKFNCFFRLFHDNPEELFLRYQYARLGRTSIIGASMDLGVFVLPRTLLEIFVPHMIRDYNIYSFSMFKASR